MTANPFGQDPFSEMTSGEIKSHYDRLGMMLDFTETSRAFAPVIRAINDARDAARAEQERRRTEDGKQPVQFDACSLGTFWA